MGLLFECGMLLCFGVSWPVSVYKSYRSRTAKGKSLVFLLAILVGYVCGIFGKIVTHNINYVLIMYGINFCMVLCDVLLYFRNRGLDRRRERTPEADA